MSSPRAFTSLLLNITLFTLLPGILTYTLTPRRASGINCDGSISCHSYRGQLADIRDKVNAIAIGMVFNTGDQLACTGASTQLDPYDVEIYTGDGLCASVGHNTPSITIGHPENRVQNQKNSAGDVIQDLIIHGCAACGTATTNRFGNWLADECISVNYVQQVCASATTEPCRKK